MGGKGVETVVVDLVAMKRSRLSLPLRTRLAEPRRDRDHHAPFMAARDLELVARTNRGLVDVAGEDQVGAG